MLRELKAPLALSAVCLFQRKGPLGEQKKVPNVIKLSPVILN